MNNVIEKKTKAGQNLAIEVNEKGRTIVRVDGKVIPCVKCEGPVWADFTVKGMGVGYVVNGVSFVTEEEGLKIKEAIAAAKLAVSQAKASARAELVTSKKSAAIAQGQVSLQYHEYHTGCPVWSVFYGDLEIRVYPAEGYRGLDRKHDSEHMAGHTWQVTEVELAAVLNLPETEQEPQYSVDPQMVGEPEGSEALAAAAEALAAQQAEYDRAQEREQIADHPNSAPLRQLEAKYPRAATLRDLRNRLGVAQDDRLASALEKATTHLLAGGSTEDAIAISKDWGH